MAVIYVSSLLLYVFGLLNLFGVERAFFYRQLVFVIIGFVAFIMIRKMGIEFFRLNTKLFYWIFIVIMLLTYVIGFEANGSRRWIDLYFFSFQASEFFKIFFILFLATYFSHHSCSCKIRLFKNNKGRQ